MGSCPFRFLSLVPPLVPNGKLRQIGKCLAKLTRIAVSKFRMFLEEMDSYHGGDHRATMYAIAIHGIGEIC